MSSTLLCALIFLACALTFSGAQTSCRGRCGGEYYRGYRCQCDYNCLSYGECCDDYESQCTTKNSCKGRCGENFKRGRLCSCDSDCVRYSQCCPDYKNHCDAQDQTLKEATDQLSTFSEGNDDDDSSVPPVGPTSHPPDDPTDVSGPIFPTEDFSKTEPEDPEASPVPEISSDYELSTVDPLGEISTEATPTSDNDDLVSTTAEAPSDSTTADHISSEPTSASVPSVEPSSSSSSPQLDAQTPAVAIMDAVFPSDEPDNSLLTITPASTTIPEESTSNHPEEHTASHPEDVTASHPEDVTASNPSVLPSTSASSVGSEEISMVEAVTTNAPLPTTAAWSDATDDLQTDTSKPTGAQEPEPTPPVEKPEPYPAKPTSKPDTKPLETQNIDDTGDYQADDSNDTNLCSGRPVSGVTTLRNGTVVVFRGHYFWLLNSNRVPGPPRGITQEWGVPSPIDTVFTRCNCQGKTYIFKGSQYWRFENNALDPGYPKVITTGFDGLRGHITAALSVPQYKRRAESVYFFKRGGTVQKYSYQAGVSPTCGKPAIYTVRNRVVRQAAPVLGPVIKIRTSWRGFPPAVTAAVSVPTTAEPEGYRYFVFSGPKSYNVRLDGESPVVAPPKAGSSPQSNKFIRCSQ